MQALFGIKKFCYQFNRLNHTAGVWCQLKIGTSPGMSEVRGGGQECQAAVAQEWPRGATPRLRSGVAAERSYHMSEVRGTCREEQTQIQEAVAAQVQEGREDLLHIQGQEEQP